MSTSSNGVWSMGVGELLASLHKLEEQEDFSTDFLARLRHDGAYAADVAAAMKNLYKEVKVVGRYSVPVNHELSFPDHAKAAGFKWWASGQITDEAFPKLRHGTEVVEIALFDFGWRNAYVSEEDVRRQIEEKGYRPIDIRELFALAAVLGPKDKRDIIALGQKYFKDDTGEFPEYPLLKGSGKERTILRDHASAGHTHNLYAAVKL